MYAKNELMFPPYVIPMLRDQRGKEWQKLVDRVLSVEEDHPEALAMWRRLSLRLCGALVAQASADLAARRRFTPAETLPAPVTPPSSRPTSTIS